MVKKEDGESRLYYHATRRFLDNVRRWIDKYRIKEPIQYIFERGDEGYDEVQRVLNLIMKNDEQRTLINLASFTNADKKCVVQLQAAGICAYEIYKQIANQHLPKHQHIPERESYKILMRKYDEPFNSFDNKKNLAEVLAQYEKDGGTYLEATYPYRPLPLTKK